ARFEADDEQLFFGREDITELIAFLAEQHSDLPLMLVGASGAGKSSLLRAGLLPRLRAAAAARPAARADQVTIYDPTVTGVPELPRLTPSAASSGQPPAGAQPDSAWGMPADATSAWGRDATAAAVIVDQFEAVFTLCPDEAGRSAL